MKTAVIFDMDGVIIDSEPIYLEYTQNFLKSRGYSVTDNSELLQLVGCNNQIFEKKISEWTNQELSIKDFHQGFDDFYTENPMDIYAMMYEDVPEIMQWLSQNNIPIVVASSSRPDVIEESLSVCKIDHLIKHQISGFSFKESKPNPAIYLHSAEILGIPTSKCLAVEDSPYGIEAAKRAGITVLARKDNTFGMDQSGADGIINSLLEIKNYFELR